MDKKLKETALHKGGLGKPMQEAEREALTGSLKNTALLSLVLAVAHIASGRLAFLFSVQDGNLNSGAAFSQGIALAFAVLYGGRIWPGIFLGQLVLSCLWSHAPLGYCFSIAVLCSFQNVLGGYLFRRWNISAALSRPRDIGLFFALCCLVIQPLSATGGLIARHLAGLGVTGKDWLSWWAGNILGQIIVAPLVLSWARAEALLDRKEIRNSLFVIGGYFLLVTLFFTQGWREKTALAELIFFAAFYLGLIWVAARSGMRTVSLANLLIGGALLWVIHLDPDVLLFFSPESRFLCADFFIIGGLATSLVVSALFEELISQARQLRMANAAREKLFSVIGHDLRGPVANLKQSLDFVADGTLTPEAFIEIRVDLHKGVNGVHDALENLMEWGGAQIGLLKPKFARINLRETAQEAIEFLHGNAAKKGIVIDNALPEKALIRADPNQLQSIFRNLLTNSLKFTPSGGLGRITLQAEWQDGFWHVDIRDNGIGMEADRAAHLFDLGEQFGSTFGTNNERGLGLGLQICREFVQVHHGTIRAKSSPHRGTNIVFTLPAAQATAT